MVERFKGRNSGIVNQARFDSTAELESPLRNYLKIYNNIPQRALKHQTSIQVLKKWPLEKSGLYVKQVYIQAAHAI